MALLPEFGNGLMTFAAFVIALSIIVAIHEFGHYIVGRWSGIHAEVFSLGFGPVLLSGTDGRGTKWQLAALPFGGYVRFAGDANAASGADGEVLREMTETERRRTMHGAPIWARSATVAAGPIFNFILSILVFAGLFMTRGDVADPLTVGELRPLPAEAQAQLRPGDEVLSIAGMDVPPISNPNAFAAFSDAIPLDGTMPWQIRREGEVLTVDGPQLLPPIVSQLAPQSAAWDIGLKKGDVITSVDGMTIHSFSELKAQVEGSDGRALLLKVFRPGEGAELDFALVPRRVDEPNPEGGFRTEWRIGIVGGMAFVPATESAGVVSSLRDGVLQTVSVMTSSISGLWHMITGAISTCNMTGPIGIAQTSGAMAAQGVETFVWFVAVLSTAVGLLNLFPVPVLDGGHLVFHAWEAVTGHPPSDRALRVLMAVGLTLILSLMVFALGNDLFCP